MYQYYFAAKRITLHALVT